MKNSSDLFLENLARVTRRQLFGSAGQGIGLAALATLLGREAQAGQGTGPNQTEQGGLPGLPHHAPKAKRMVMLWQGGGPSHVDLFDPKPMLIKQAGKDVPASVRGSTRLAAMLSGSRQSASMRSWSANP